MSLRANRRHHVFLPGPLIGRSVGSVMSQGSDGLSDLCDRF